MFEVGEEVICVTQESVCPRCGHLQPGYEHDWPQVGKHYIVAETSIGFCDSCFYMTQILNPVGMENPYWGWPHWMFRRPEVDEAPIEVKQLEPVDA